MFKGSIWYTDIRKQGNTKPKQKIIGDNFKKYEGSLIEHAGMLKMDFLGLKTLTIIKNTLRMVKKNHNVDLNIDTIPLDDEETFKLFQRGDTIGVFQFESEGMRQSLYKKEPNACAFGS